jgi:hypothetical protein
MIRFGNFNNPVCQLFGHELNVIIEELNEALAA